jgi:hypothetical protein
MKKIGEPIIKRYLSDINLKRIQNDFQFLINIINSSFGEFLMSIREEYFNIYYKGNSLAKIRPMDNDSYKISIHTKFFENTKADNLKYFKKKIIRNSYSDIELSNDQLHPFLQKIHINEFASKIKYVNNGEEIAFEQSIITDNLNRCDFIFIDRQISDKEFIKRIDLLAIKQVEKDQYQFVITEVKLGNNIELKDKVASQLDVYQNHIKSNFIDYKICYEKQYHQMKVLELIKFPSYNDIEIVEPVEGLIIVGGYSGNALNQINSLNKKYPNLNVKHFTFKI